MTYPGPATGANDSTKLMKKTLTSSMKSKKINQNTKRKTELEVNFIHSYIAGEAALPANRPPRMEGLSPSELDTQESDLKTFITPGTVSTGVLKCPILSWATQV